MSLERRIHIRLGARGFKSPPRYDKEARKNSELFFYDIVVVRAQDLYPPRRTGVQISPALRRKNSSPNRELFFFYPPFPVPHNRPFASIGASTAQNCACHTK